MAGNDPRFWVVLGIVLDLLQTGFKVGPGVKDQFDHAIGQGPLFPGLFQPAGIRNQKNLPLFFCLENCAYLSGRMSGQIGQANAAISQQIP